MKLFKFSLLLLLLFLITNLSFKKQENLVNWNIEVNKLKDNLFEIKYVAKIEPGYLLYSKNNNSQLYYPINFEFKENLNLVLYPILEIGTQLIKTDKGTNIPFLYYKDNLVLTQLVKTKIPTTNLDIKIIYSVLSEIDDNNQKQLNMSEKKFNIVLDNNFIKKINI